ncbi:MAG: acyltransferase family protein [Acidimicrobiales bacterium]
MTAVRRTLGHEPALDGLRGLAVAAVLLYHLAQANTLDGMRTVTKGGFLGVSAFLTLSGFLITSLLILEFESIGHISLGGFWGRRFRRLLPASLLTLAVVAVLTPVIGSQSQLGALPGEIWATLGYVVNWKFIVSGSDYAATFNGAPSPIKHFWSLAVEEQCYFVLPFVVALTMRLGLRARGLKGRLPVAVAFGLIVAASTATLILLSGGAYANRVYMGTDTRAAELAVGALLAVFVAGRPKLTGRPAFLVSSVLGPLALGMIFAAWMTTDLQAKWLYRGGFTLHAIAVGVVILAALQPQSALRAVLAVRPLTELGRISYGVYLIHWPVLWWMTPTRLHLAAPLAAVVQVLTTLALATLSYHLVEQPIRTGRIVISKQRALVPLCAMAAVAIIAWALPAPNKARVVALSASKEAVIPTTAAPKPNETAPPPPLRVMVVGDSFALSVGLGLEHYSLSTGKIAVLNTGIVGCGFGRGGMNRGIGLEREWPDACQQREATLEQKMALFRPDIVLCTGGMWDITDRKPLGFRSWTHVGDARYDQYLAGEFQHLTDFLGGTGAKVVWATAPRFDPQYNPQTFMGKPPYFESQAGRSDQYNQVLRLALAARPAASIIDLAAWMKAQPGGEFDPSLRIDGVHFTEESTDRVAREFIGPQLLGQGVTPHS